MRSRAMTRDEVIEYLCGKEGITDLLSMATADYGFYLNPIPPKCDGMIDPSSWCLEEKRADILLKGGSISIGCDYEDEDEDREEGMPHMIDLQKWREGIEKCLDGKPRVLKEWAEDTADYYTAFATLQYIVFGKEIYC